jgi:hypothetical protein
MAYRSRMIRRICPAVVLYAHAKPCRSCELSPPNSSLYAQLDRCGWICLDSRGRHSVRRKMLPTLFGVRAELSSCNKSAIAAEIFGATTCAKHFDFCNSLLFLLVRHPLQRDDKLRFRRGVCDIHPNGSGARANIYMAQKELQRLWTRVETLCLTLDTEPDSNVESRRQYCRDRRPMSARAGSVRSSCHCRANLSRGPIGVDTVPTQCSSLELCRVRAMDSVCSVSMRFTYDSSSDVFFHRGGNCAVY